MKLIDRIMSMDGMEIRKMTAVELTDSEMAKIVGGTGASTGKVKCRNNCRYPNGVYTHGFPGDRCPICRESFPAQS